MVLNQNHTPSCQEEQPAASFLLASSMKAIHYSKRAAGRRKGLFEAFNLGVVVVCMHMSTQMEGLIETGAELWEVVGSHG